MSTSLRAKFLGSNLAVAFRIYTPPIFVVFFLRILTENQVTGCELTVHCYFQLNPI